MHDLISIIVTSYNHAEYLEQRIESLLAQTYKNLEIIVVDDCSSDRSIRVLDKYLMDERIRIVALDANQGYAYASNLGVSLSHGDYIMFAECDDFSESGQVEILHEVLSRNTKVGVVYSKSNMVGSDGRKWGDDFRYRETAFRELCFRDTLIPRDRMQRFFLKSCVIPNMSAAMIRKVYFNEVGGLSQSYRACADWDFWCRIAKHCDFYYIATQLNNFRSHASTVRETVGITSQLLEMYRLLYDAYRKTELNRKERCKFKINTGFIWASYIPSSLTNWLKSFFPVWMGSLRYDPFTVIYLMIAIAQILFIYTTRFIIKKQY